MGSDSRWQSSYQAQTLGQESNDGIGTVAKRRTGKKQLPRPGEVDRGLPFATGGTPFLRSPLVRQDDMSIHVSLPPARMSAALMSLRITKLPVPPAQLIPVAPP